jgi:hypothetical protein
MKPKPIGSHGKLKLKTHFQDRIERNIEKQK